MSTDVIGYIIGGVFALVAGLYAQRSTTKSANITKAAADAIEQNRLQVDKVRADGEAYDRAEGINRRMVEDLTAEVARLSKELSELRLQLRTEVQNSAELEQQVNRLQSSVDRLTALLRQHNIPLPAIGI